MTAKLGWQSLPAALMVLLGLSGCLEHSVKTTVTEDGSCERTYTVTADSGKAPQTKLPLPADTSWTFRWQRKEGANGFLWTASKRFPTLDALSGELSALNRPGMIHVTLQAGTAFRWFYTYIQYRETYRRFTPLTRIDPREVMTDDEITRFTRGEGGDTLKSKVEEWKSRNYADYFISTLDTLVTAMPDDEGLAASLQSARRAVLLALAGKKDITEMLAAYNPAAGKKRMVQDSTMALTPQGVEAMRRLLVQNLGSDSARKLPVEEAWRRTVHYVTLMSDADAEGEFTNVLVLPGLFLDTNAGTLKGNAASWSFKRDQLELMEYDMVAESRVVNTWAFIVAGGVALAFVAGFLIPHVIRRQRPGAAARA